LITLLSYYRITVLPYHNKAEEPEDLQEEEIVKKLRASGGAHQPTSYEFSNYSVGATSPTKGATATPAEAEAAPSVVVEATPEVEEST
jgi:hypothetical protein